MTAARDHDGRLSRLLPRTDVFARDRIPPARGSLEGGSKNQGRSPRVLGYFADDDTGHFSTPHLDDCPYVARVRLAQILPTELLKGEKIFSPPRSLKGPSPELGLAWSSPDIGGLVSHMCLVGSRESVLDHSERPWQFLRMPAGRDAILFGERGY